MKFVNARDAAAGLAALMKEAQKEPQCITRHGRPVVVLLGVEGQEIEQIVAAYQMSREPSKPRRTRR